jgi:hypothetical protein
LGSDASAWSPYTAAFAQRLRELGWIEGRTIAIEYRWSEGRSARNGEIAGEFVRMKVDVIVTNAFAASTVKQAIAVSNTGRFSQSRPGKAGRGQSSSLLRNVRIGDHRAPFGDVGAHTVIKLAGRRGPTAGSREPAGSDI